MRRPTTVLIAALSSFYAMGCEDGPNQTYSPAPTGARDLFNDGKSAPQIDPAQASLTATYAGKSRQEICSADEKRTAWANMLNKEIAPPRRYAGLDMAGSDNWEGLTVEAAEQINCQAVDDGSGGTGLGAVHWGNNGEVEFFYNLGTHVVAQMELFNGYNGKMKMKGRQPGGTTCYNYTNLTCDATGAPSTTDKFACPDPSCPNKDDTYEMGLSTVFTKNGKPFLIQWDPTGVDVVQEEANITELYDAAVATFGTGIPASYDCVADRGCLDFADAGDGTAIFGFRPLAVYFITRQFTPNPLPSTPITIYNFFVKTLPYSNNPMEIKLDAEGPTANAKIGTAGKDCVIQLGTPYQAFLDNCVNVSTDPKVNQEAYAKLIGGHFHTFDDVTFNVVGVNNNFTLKKDTFKVVLDNDLPQPDDQVTEFIFDVRAKGLVKNDLGATGTLDMHGTGLVFREFARLAQAAIYQAAADAGTPIPVANQHALGDVACFTEPSAAGCTGLEGLLIPGPKLGAGVGAQTWQNLDAITVGKSGAYNKSFLTPGDPQVRFANGDSGTLWDTTYRHVIQVLGKGDIFRLPFELRDRRFFFRQYSIALTKYMKAYGARRALTNPADMIAQKLDFENIFFEVSDTDSFDKVEYVDRDYVDATHEPTNFEYGTDVKVGNQRTTQWDRKMSRPERALYTAFLPDPTAPVGKFDNVRLTNLFGSPILTANWPSAACAATGLAVDCGGADTTPLGFIDSDGLALALDYRGAWGNTILHQGNSPIQIFGVVPQLAAAKVSLPHFTDPYDNTSAQLDVSDPALGLGVQVLVPHLPKQPGVGFPIPLSGTRDKFIPAGNLDFRGNTSTYEIKYDLQTCGVVSGGTACTAGQAQYACNAGTTPMNQDFTPDGTCKATDDKKNVYCCSGKHADTINTNSLTILAIDSSDFLGDVFICQDPNSGEILKARMYDSAQSIIDWFNKHPGTTSACDIIVRYAPFDNYVDKIMSRANGVTIDISKSQNSGRVDDALLWDPVLATIQ